MKPAIVLLTGLPCCGKTTLAKKFRMKLMIEGFSPSKIIDGDTFREGLCSDLGFSPEDRTENLRRVAEVAKLFLEENNGVVIAAIAPTEKDRKMIKKIVGENNLFLVYVNCSLEECEKRDVKGMYKKARAGEIKDFTGVSAEYEVPLNTNLVVETMDADIEECIELMSYALQIWDDKRN